MRPRLHALIVATLLAAPSPSGAPAMAFDEAGVSAAARGSTGSELQPLDAQPCVGQVYRRRGLREVSDASFQASPPLGVTDQGRLCQGKVYEVISPGVTLWRVWTRSKSDSEKGQWWSFTRPRGPRSRYRRRYAICPEWNELDMVSSCRLKIGARIAVGPGQSAKCATTRYPKSAANQVFVPNDARNGVLWVEQCEAAPFP